MSGLFPTIQVLASGVSSLTLTGTAQPTFPSAMTGNAGNSAVGTLTKTSLLTKTLLGIASTSLLGNMTKTHAHTLTGAAATGAVNTFSFSPFFGANMSGLENTSGVRFGRSTAPNFNLSRPRLGLLQDLAANGMKMIRLPISWEMLQPVLTSATPNSVVKTGFGITNPGDFQPNYKAIVQAVLDDAATAGIKVLLDVHNYCRYQDFVYNPDGSITGFTVPAQAYIAPYTTDGTKVITKYCALATGATAISQADFNALWVKIVQTWAGHPAILGWGLMNEPHDMPATGGIDPWFNHAGATEDLTIWNTFAQGAVNAIRAIDTSTPIYVSGNGFSTTIGWSTNNPLYPLTGTNLVYEGHLYLDHSSSGNNFDYNFEVSLGFSAGEAGAINPNTGPNRLAPFTTWLASNGARGLVGETGMPVDDTHWYTMFDNLAAACNSAFVQITTWMGGEHWASRNYAINHNPNWYQNKTAYPLVEGFLKKQNNTQVFTIFDATQGYGSGTGVVVTVTLFARGYVPSAQTINLTRTTGTGTLSGASVVLPAGVNPSVTYTYTTVTNEKATITYSGPAQVPPARNIYSYVDPVTLAGTNLPDAGATLIAKYSAGKWVAPDAFKDYVNAAAATTTGDKVRAISDSGNFTTKDNIIEMVNWVSEGTLYGPPSAPTFVSGAHPSFHMTDFDSWGLWCKKWIPNFNGANTENTPFNVAMHNLEDSHFAIVAINPDNVIGSGTAWQSSLAEGSQKSELYVAAGVPQARFIDVNGTATTLTSGSGVAAGVASVISLTATTGSQALRLNGVSAATAAATFPASKFNQHIMGMGFTNFFTSGAFPGSLYGAIAGKGAPTSAEMLVMERYLGNTFAGMSL